MNAKVTLTVTAGPRKGAVYSYSKPDNFLLGRSPDCHFVVEGDTYVSRHHLLLEIDPPQAHVQDLGSSNGTYVGEERIGSGKGGPRSEPRLLRSGDVIRAGGTSIRVSIEQSFLCAECGAPRDPALKDAPILVNGRYVCDACGNGTARVAQISARRPRAEAPHALTPAPRCVQCGAAAASSRRGDYICEACRRKAVGGDQHVIKSLFAHAVARLKGVAAAGAVSDAPHEMTAYNIESKLGDGRVGPVFLATRKANGERVVIKVMIPPGHLTDGSALKRFEREVQVTMEMKHSNIVRFISQGHTNCVYYLVTEYMPGGDLQALIKKRGALPPPEAVSILRQAAAGVFHAHRLGYIHRDLKPNDILLARPRGEWIAKVGDFGLAKSFQRVSSTGGSVMASAMSREAYAFTPREKLTDYRTMTPASDVFALGAILYHALTGGSVWRSAGGNPMEAILDGRIVPVAQSHPEIPGPLALVLERSIAVESAWRYRDAGELFEALKASG